MNLVPGKLAWGTRSPVYRVTSARRGLTEDSRSRERKYLITMGIRSACFVLAIVVHGPVRFVLLIAALVAPYLAVVFANGGREPATTEGPDADRDHLDTRPAPAIEPGSSDGKS